MDEIVMKAMAKWPNVPACRGWLGLDGRGNWYMRDDAAQAAGPFAGRGATLASKGSQLTHTALIEFIGRNYAANEAGEWYFQNGPQRVYVELSDAPWVVRVDASGQFSTHTGRRAQVSDVLMDEVGKAYVNTQMGLGLVHSMDVLYLAHWLDQRGQKPTPVRQQILPERFGYCLSPAMQT